ncbi:MAG: molybdopterin-dependent oxidoreductase, partial [Pseudomonadota bacterium]
ARVRQREVPWDEGIRAAAESLDRVCREAGPEAIACLGSTRSSLESQGALKRFCRQQGWPDPRFFLDPAMAAKVKKAISRLDARLAVSMAEIEEADFILAIGADPVNEAPMLALAMRQACRRGAPVAMIDPRPLSLPFKFEHLAVSPGNLETCLSALVRKAVSRDTAEHLGAAALEFYDALPAAYTPDPGLDDRLTGIGQIMQKCQRPVLICGTDIVRETTPGLAADLAHLIRAMVKRAGVFYLLPGPNAFGAALLSPAQEPAPLVKAIERGDIKALVLVESDPFCLYPDQKRLAKALDKLDLLLVMDYLPSQSVERAHIVLPLTTLFEGTPSGFANQEGRLQVASPVHAGGFPIAQISDDKHPPRIFLQDIPGGEPKMTSAVFKDLSIAVSGQGEGMSGDDLRAWMVRENPALEGLLHPSGPTESRRLISPERTEEDFAMPGTFPQEGEGSLHDQLELLLVERTYGTEELSGYSRITQQVETPPQAHMHREDAGRLGLSVGGKVSLELDGMSLVLELHISESMATGVVVLPRHRQLVRQGMKSWRMTVPCTSIRRCN